jgi:hypothetical protein
MKGESEGHPYRHSEDPDHVIPAAFRQRMVVIRPRHRLPAAFLERRWPILLQSMEIGRLRAREVLLGESHAETETHGDAGLLTSLLSRLLMTRILAAARRTGSPARRPLP